MNKFEQIDVVDEKDNVLYSATKQEAHNKGLLHRTVIGELRNLKGEWILVKQSADRQDAGKYVSPVGGHVKAGELEEDALKREALEEIGIQNFEYKLIGKAIFNRNVLGRQENHFFIYYEIHTDQNPTSGDEVESFIVFTTDELKRKLKESPDEFGGAFHFVMRTFYPETL